MNDDILQSECHIYINWKGTLDTIHDRCVILKYFTNNYLLIINYEYQYVLILIIHIYIVVII